MRTIIIAALCFSVSLVVADNILVTLPNGQIRGRALKTPANKTFYGFQGIPFATPPLGALRFQAPIPAKNWNGVFDATKEGNDCINKEPQLQTDVVRLESEDCLFINVYTPKLSKNASTTKLLPVMFWIYGGGFTFGTSSTVLYGPDYLIEEDIIFVSANYRLGPLGFLSTGDKVIPGNAGLKDQNLALKWTNENIHLFGGDKNKITIFGESAGGAAVTYQVLSDKSAGLFRAAIAESGTALGLWSLNTDPLPYAYDLVSQIAKDHNISIDNNTLTTEGIRDFLLNQTSENIKAADLKLLKYSTTVPVLEYPHENAFISEANYQLLESGKSNKVTFLTGFNSEEFLYIINDPDFVTKYSEMFDKNIESLIPTDLILNKSTNKTKVAEAIKKIYLRSNELFASNLGAFVRYFTDLHFVTPAIKFAELQSKFADVYFYEFSYDGELGKLSNISVNGTLGTVEHFEEVLYLFRQSSAFGKETDLNKYPPQDVLTHKRMVKLWTNFAKFLDPTPRTAKIFQNVRWPVLRRGCFEYLNIGENLEIMNGYPRKGSYQQWNKIYNTWGVKPFITF